MSELYLCKKSFWDFGYKKIYYILFVLLQTIGLIVIYIGVFYFKQDLIILYFAHLLYLIGFIALVENYFKTKLEVVKIILYDNDFIFFKRFTPNKEIKDKYTEIQEIYKKIINFSNLNGIFIKLKKNNKIFLSNRISNIDELKTKLLEYCCKNGNKIKFTYKLF